MFPRTSPVSRCKNATGTCRTVEQSCCIHSWARHFFYLPPPEKPQRQAPVGVLMDEAKQSFCVIAGGKEYIRDSILAAMLAKNQIFPSLNMLVVPVEMDVASSANGPKGLAKGFGSSSLSYEEQGYVAAPVNVSVCAVEFVCVKSYGD